MYEEKIRYVSFWFCSVWDVTGFFLVICKLFNYSKYLLILRLVPVASTYLISAVIFCLLGGSHLFSLFNDIGYH